MHVVVYSDASMSDIHEIATCGYIIIINGKEVKHDIYILEGVYKSTYAESKAICLGVEYVLENIAGVTKITAKTDCKSLVTKWQKNKIFSSDFVLIHERIKNKKINFCFRHVKGHGKDQSNQKIDVSCRKYLRDHLKQNNLAVRKELIPMPGGKLEWI